MEELGYITFLGVLPHYPFGMLTPGRNWSAIGKNYAFGYQGSLQDDEIYGNGNVYSTFYRELDPRIGRWWSNDAKTRQTPWESPYISMGNNPISRNDIYGDEWKDKSDEKKADQMKSNFVEKESMYNNRAEKYSKKLSEALEKNNDKKSEKYSNLLSTAIEGRNEMRNAQTEIGVMGASSTVFRFNYLDNASYGYTSFDADGTVAINYVNNDANTAHEMKHAYQTLSGEIVGIPGTNQGKYADLIDEVESYTRQYFFSTLSMPNSTYGRITKASDITRFWVKGVYALENDGATKLFYTKALNYNIDLPTMIL
ncbi:MAG: hypothetical protein IPG60_07520 [Bacteroidetes bacterium]|nr:hypothetical protein [Bacteroidota bacterium]